MKVFKLAEMTRGWFVGDFAPAALRTDAVEVAVQTYVAGAVEPRHVHRLAPEVTLILRGEARINGRRHGEGDIVVSDKGEAMEFEAMTDVVTVVVKIPSVPGDKHPC